MVIVNTFETEEEVLARANDSEYGLFGMFPASHDGVRMVPLIIRHIGSLYTKDVERALRFAKEMEAGAIGLNCSAPTHGLDMPVGRWKQSGIGREMFTYSMENFLQIKTVYFKYADVSMMH